MGRYSDKLALRLFLPISLIVAPAYGAVDDTLLSQAQSGHSHSQFELAKAYQQENQNNKAHYWFLKSALGGNQEAIYELGSLFESSNSKDLGSLSLAENWYQLGIEYNEPRSEEGYARVLEAQFNNRRQKQVSSITMLDEQIDEDIQNESDSNPLGKPADSIKNNIITDTFFIPLLLLFVLVATTVRRLFRIKRDSHKRDLQHKIANQNKKILSLQRHLNAAHKQLQLSQKIQKQLDKTEHQDAVRDKARSHSNNQEQSISLAYALLGFQPQQTPNERELKLRYKKLSKIYHPDASGSEEEMKRLNAAVRIVNAHQKQKKHQTAT